ALSRPRLGLLDLYEVADLAQHAGEHRGLRLLDAAPDLAEPERAQRAAVPLALADLASSLRDSHARHVSSRPSSYAENGAWASRARWHLLAGAGPLAPL